MIGIKAIFDTIAEIKSKRIPVAGLEGDTELIAVSTNIAYEDCIEILKSCISSNLRQGLEEQQAVLLMLRQGTA